MTKAADKPFPLGPFGAAHTYKAHIRKYLNCSINLEFYDNCRNSRAVSRDFLFRTLSAFGFGPSFIQWIHTFYSNISSCVLNNGFSTQPFPVERGVRQGDPLSAFLFIMVLEILCISIRNNKDIHGIVVDSEEIKLGLFADDMIGFFEK